MKILFTLFLTIVIASWLFKRLAPYLLMWFFKKVKQKAETGAFGQPDYGRQYNQPNYPPGHIDIDYSTVNRQSNSQGRGRTSNQAGEYIDFEEVKE